jgi:hypothetical protein
MSEDEKSFTVSDRRHFTAEGKVREAEAEAPQPEPSNTEETNPSVDFAGFLMSLGMQASALLDAAHAGGEDADQALPATRSIISILEMLRAKTEGNRTEEESRVLESLLYDLRMGYVEARRVEGS